MFRRDRATGAVALVSRADGAAGAAIAGEFYDVDISADGRRVAFSVGNGAGPKAVWVRDVAAGRTFLASRADGENGDAATAGRNAEPALDADGSRVAFVSGTPALAPGDNDTVQDVLVRDLDQGTTVLASRADGAKDDIGSGSPDLSADGNRVAFVSAGTKFPGAGGISGQAYVRDIAAGTLRHVSTVASGPASPVGALSVSIDAAGDRVAYTAPNGKSLAPGESVTTVFIADVATGAVTLASRADGADGAQADSDALAGVISPDGGAVVFATDAANLGATPGVAQVFRRDLAGGRTTLVSRRAGAAGAPMATVAQVGGLSTGGGCVSFTSADGALLPQVYLRAVGADCVPPTGGGGEGPGGGGRGGGGGPAADTTAPVVSGLRMTRPRFAVARGRTARTARAPRGSAFVFRLSEDARATIAIKRCRGRRCAKAVAKLTRAGTGTGSNRVAFTGRIGRKALHPGRYRATVTATDRAGNVSAPRTIRFRIVRR